MSADESSQQAVGEVAIGVLAGQLVVDEDADAVVGEDVGERVAGADGGGGGDEAPEIRFIGRIAAAVAAIILL